MSRVHASILQTYQADFVKYAIKLDLARIGNVFEYLMSHPCRKIKYSQIAPDELSRDTKRCLKLLSQAKVVQPVLHSSCSGIPLQSTADDRVFKTITLDVGLMNHMQRLSWQAF